MSSSPTPPRRIAVIGGGITGLSALRELHRARAAGSAVSALLIEAGERLGGVIRTDRVDGFTIEAGPDSFLTEKPEAAELCREVGLGEELMGSNDASRRTGILHHGRLDNLPDGLYFFIPSRLRPVVTTPLLPLSAKFRLLRDLWMRPSRTPDRNHRDESAAQFIRRHFGQAMLETIADPLLSGVYGGDAERLSARSVLPRFWAMEAEQGSLIRGMLRARRRARGAQAPQPIFTTLRGGLAAMIAPLIPSAPPDKASAECAICLKTRVTAIAVKGTDRSSSEPAAPRYAIRLDGGKLVEADAVILAIPTHEASRLLTPLDPALSEALGGIAYSSALTVVLAFDEVLRLPPGFGFLIPKKERRQMLACTFVHQKFHHRAPTGKALLRCFLGGTAREATLEMEDAEIVSLVRHELREILAVRAEPCFHRLYRWPRSMPQYNVGHEKRLAAIHNGKNRLPGIFLAGNAYSGIGISDCIRTGKLAAHDALNYLAASG